MIDKRRLLAGCQTGVVALGLTLAIAIPTQAYPEFQAYAEKHSGRTTNCAMCHVNANGPSGEQEGQIGSLTPQELERLNQARSALEPGQEVDSPILNSFGNYIMKSVGKKKVLEARTRPELLVEALGNTHDLDGDGISDAQEFQDGTDALNKFHGDPARLFVNNLSKYVFDVILAVIAVAVLVFGLANIVTALQILAERAGKRE
jgi:hypothetical protein